VIKDEEVQWGFTTPPSKMIQPGKIGGFIEISLTPR
jgi:hypothetical protein